MSLAPAPAPPAPRRSAGLRLGALTGAAGLCALACADDPARPSENEGTIAVQVLVEGSAFADGSVVLTTSGGLERSNETDEDGRTRFAGLDLGSYTLEGSAPGRPVLFDDAAPTVLTRDALSASVEVTGRWDRSGVLAVRVEAGGQPVGASTVSLVGPFEGYGRIETEGMTDAEGQVTFAQLVPGTYAVSLAAFDASRYSFASATQAVDVRARATAERVFQGERLDQGSPAPVGSIR